MNILITGCNGQLGNELRLLEAADTANTYYNTDVEQLDITDVDAIGRLIDEHAIDGIVNCAAYTAVDKAEEAGELCQRLNAEAPAYLAAAVEQCGGWIIQISTDYVFDGEAFQPYTEADDTCPTSTYGRTKLVGEFNVLKLCRRAMVIRTAWLYSSFGNNFVKTMMRLGRERQELGVVSDQIGSPTYARDLARTIMAVVKQGIQPGIYHFTNEGVASWYDFAKAIHRLAGIDTCRVRPLSTAEYPTPARRPHYSVLDKTKIKQAYGIEIPHWEESLADCMALLLAP